MTKLHKIIRRETDITDKRGTPIIVTLEPSQEITFRPKGKRRMQRLYLGHAYNLAIIMTAQLAYEEAMKRYRSQKKAGVRFARKPRRASFPFSEVYFKAVSR